MTKKFFVGLALIASMSLVAFTVAPSESTKTEQTARKTFYGGSASVRLKNTDTGETKTKNTTTCCCHETSSSAKTSLRQGLEATNGTYWVLDGAISYDIDTCER